jgi:hypothetical protein
MLTKNSSSMGLNRFTMTKTKITNLLIRGALLFVIVALLTQNHWQPLIYTWQCNRLTSEISEKYDLVLRYGDPSDFFVHPSPPLVNIPEKGFFIERTETKFALTALTGVKMAIVKYPPSLIRKYLKAVFITGILKIYGVQGGGSYFDSWIYLSALEKYESSGPDLYAENFHHELSSLFLRDSLFPKNSWQSVNEVKFSYMARQIDVVKSAAQENRKDKKNSSTWYHAGFVSDYGMSSLENDFNTYAEMAMTRPKKLKQLSIEYPRIKAKTILLIDFYSKLAPELREYFQTVGLNDNLARK